MVSSTALLLNLRCEGAGRFETSSGESFPDAILVGSNEPAAARAEDFNKSRRVVIVHNCMNTPHETAELTLLVVLFTSRATQEQDDLLPRCLDHRSFVCPQPAFLVATTN